DGSLYCGWTVDVPKRVEAHATGKASRYTATRRPHTLAAAWEVPTHTDARRRNARTVCLTRPLGEVPPATGLAPAFWTPRSPAILDASGNTPRRPGTHGQPHRPRARRRAGERSTRRHPAHPHRTACNGRPARRVGRGGQGLLLAG